MPIYMCIQFSSRGSSALEDSHHTGSHCEQWDGSGSSYYRWVLRMIVRCMDPSKKEVNWPFPILQCSVKNCYAVFWGEFSLVATFLMHITGHKSKGRRTCTCHLQSSPRKAQRAPSSQR
jgi:hypothetical protein